MILLFEKKKQKTYQNIENYCQGVTLQRYCIIKLKQKKELQKKNGSELCSKGRRRST